MRNLVLTALSGAALIAFATPAMAQRVDGDDEHQEQHEQLGDQHEDVHGDLNGIHSEAHEEGLSRGEHRRLHRQLDGTHARADGNLEAEHYYEHQYQPYSYGGYGGYSNGYYGNGRPQGYYGANGYNGYNNGYSLRVYGRTITRRHRYSRYRGY